MKIIDKESAKTLVDEYIVPGVRSEVLNQLREFKARQIAPLQRSLGYIVEGDRDGVRFVEPSISLMAKIDALAEFLGVKFEKTAPSPGKVSAVKKGKA